jgi:hypothetical protein
MIKGKRRKREDEEEFIFRHHLMHSHGMKILHTTEDSGLWYRVNAGLSLVTGQ